MTEVNPGEEEDLGDPEQWSDTAGVSSPRPFRYSCDNGDACRVFPYCPLSVSVSIRSCQYWVNGMPTSEEESYVCVEYEGASARTRCLLRG